MHFARKISYRLWFVWVSVVVCGGLMALTPGASAQGTGAISQSFSTSDSSIVNGTLLSLQQKDQQTVEAANTDNVGLLVGVSGSQPLLALSANSSSGNQVQVVIGGTTLTLVSDINGSISTGDKITASPITGVGMKATSSTQIVGTAEANFDTSTAATHSITDTSGHAHTVHVGLLPIQVNVNYYSVPAQKTSVLPGFLQNFADSVAGHDVSALRLFLGGVVLLLGLVSIGIILSSAVRSSIISIGRNPLSEGAVQKSLFKVGGMGFGILLVMVITIYLILRL